MLNVVDVSAVTSLWNKRFSFTEWKTGFNFTWNSQYVRHLCNKLCSCKKKFTVKGQDFPIVQWQEDKNKKTWRSLLIAWFYWSLSPIYISIRNLLYFFCTIHTTLDNIKMYDRKSVLLVYNYCNSLCFYAITVIIYVCYYSYRLYTCVQLS